jgi:hypothetical protein
VVRSRTVRVEIHGKRVSAEALWATASELGHFTAMQIRGGKTRGLTLHLDRLEAANRELFGAALDRYRVRQFIRQALGDADEASLRVYVLSRRTTRRSWSPSGRRRRSRHPSGSGRSSTSGRCLT